MKGKGKGKAMQDPTDCCPLRFPDLTPIEHTATCPRYTATLARTEGETIIEDELALLQVELETLLVSVTRRSQLLNAESQALADWLESRGGKAGEARVLANKQSKGKVIPPASTPKRGRPQQDASKSASKKQKTQVPPATTTAAAAKASVSQSPAPVKKTAVTVLHCLFMFKPEMNGCVTRSGLVRSFAISNSASLERRIKRELEEHGLFNSDDEKSSENPDDEILQELRKRQSELKALTAHNLTQKKRLYKLAKDEMGKQEMRKKMQIADMEVMEAYRRISVTRQKKKVPTKKERDLVWKALKDRESMLRMLGSAS
ncbi:PREDICTED: transcriptional adapter 3-A-like [Priapulus caudatus]|uniref:Transcriptional adapter 3-A-like n=1 Tax=Priapulus caudatus TaxID=37621 RepID=A0ABM1F1A0_PRICU|nr:PREDICTED: transcriptional adapter 3-A-like [Priapulus caudatus]